MTNLAISRRPDVVSRVEGDETLVLDLQTQTAHCLSGDVAVVWTSGETSLSGLVADTGLTRQAVEEAVASLAELGLVTAAAAPGLSRRTLITRGAAVGGAVVAAGAISIPLPAAARANSATITVTNASCSTSTSKLTYTLTISGLTPGATYKVSVRYNSGGNTKTDTLTNGALAPNSGTLSFTTTTGNAYNGTLLVTVTNTAPNSTDTLVDKPISTTPSTC